MAYLDRMGREGVRELVSDGEIARPEQLAERRARLDEQRRQNAPFRSVTRSESEIDNEAELRDALRQAIAERTAAEHAHRQAEAALARGNEAARLARADADEAGAEVERIGTDLAERFTAWVADGGEGTEPAADEAGPAAARHVSLQPRAVALERAATSLAVAEGSARAALAAAAMRVQQSVHRVVAREAEVIARHVEAMRSEADALAAGISQIGSHFGPHATAGAVHHTATARLTGFAVVSPRIVGAETTAARRMREAWGHYVQALATDADARLVLPDLASVDLTAPERPVPMPLAL